MVRCFQVVIDQHNHLIAKLEASDAEVEAELERHIMRLRAG